MSRIRSGLAAVTIPSWLEQPPTNLSEKQHGKLKADTWRILFTVFLPLILLELWHDASTLESRSNILLKNFHFLVYCTNIVCSYTVTSDMPELYTQYYHAYLLTLKQLFPHAKPWPNHHYTMHNAEQLKFWGPLLQVSEFFGERQNGQLQSIKTNGIFCTFQHYRPITALTTINRPDGPHHAPNNCAPTVISCLCPEHQQHQTWFNSSNIGSACNSNAGN